MFFTFLQVLYYFAYFCIFVPKNNFLTRQFRVSFFTLLGEQKKRNERSFAGNPTQGTIHSSTTALFPPQLNWLPLYRTVPVHQASILHSIYVGFLTWS
jgi:hypothetical protein